MTSSDEMPEVVRISKKGLLSFLKEIPSDVLEEACTEVKKGNAEGKKTSRETDPRNRVLFGASIILLILAGFFTPFDRPLPMDYEYSWVVFTLISMLSLQYVEFINRLKGILSRWELDSKSKSSNKKRAEKASFLLQWTGFFFIITILALAIRIIWLSFSPEKVSALNIFMDGLKGQKAVEDFKILGKAFLFCDRVIIASFILGSILRIWVFFQSYFDDMMKYWPWKWPWKRE